MKRLFGFTTKTRAPAQYLIEFRLHGAAKRFAAELSSELSKKFNVKQSARRGKPAHVTLFGPFYAPDEKKLRLEFNRFCKKYDLIKFRLGGFDHIDQKVVYLDVEPSKELEDLRRELAQNFMRFASNYPDWDAERDFFFHTTLSKDIGGKFEEIWSYLKKIETPKFNEYLLRITLLRNGRVVCEYDLIQRKKLNRAAALSRSEEKQTFNRVKEIKENGGKRRRIDFIEEGKRKVFLVSDTHFDHANIIKYCNRPFKNVEEMNAALVDNWNKIVGKQDVVYFLGDMTFGWGSRPASYWLQQLNGEIIFIEGNHEDTGKISVYPSAYDLVLRYKGTEFFLVHDPAAKPKYWNDRVIHGHVHNNDLENHPLVNHKNKTINVCAELTGYAPINMDKILSLVKNSV